MEESEKMTALKKAYAEIILNTAKEAAARIMVSERRVHQVHHDLSSTKDEALRLLLRLKQNMDSQLNEAEMKSLHQQRRIEELEAQLQEAEDIVSNLRAELNEAHTKIEEMEKNQMHNWPNMMEKAAYEKGIADNVLASEVKGLSNATIGDCIATDYLKEDNYVGVPDVPSGIVRSKKTEVCINGCTQRVHAYEGNLLNGHLPLAGELDDIKDEKILREDQEGEKTCINPLVGADVTHIAGKELVSVKEGKTVDITSCKGQVPKTVRKIRKFVLRRKRSSNSLHKSLPFVAKEARSDLPNSQTCLPDSHDMPESLNGEHKGTKSVSPSTVPLNVSEMGALSEHVAGVQGNGEVAEAHTNAMDEEGEKTCINPLVGADVTHIVGKEQVNNNEVKTVDITSCKGQVPKRVCKIRKFVLRRKRTSTSLHKSLPFVAKEARSDLPNSQTCLPDSHDMPESLNGEHKGTKSVSPSTVPLNVSEMGALSEHVAGVQGNGEVAEAHTNAMDKEGEKTCINPLVGADVTHIVGKELVNVNEGKTVDITSCKGQVPKTVRKKRKLVLRRKRTSTSLHKSLPFVAKEARSDLPNSQTCLPDSHDMPESLNGEHKGTKSVSPSTVPLNVSKMGALSEHVAGVQGNGEVAEAHTNAMDEDREVASSLVLIRQQSGAGDCSDVPNSNPEVEVKNVSSTDLDAKVQNPGEGFPNPRPRDRVLKYTFVRKRKKEALSSDDSSLLPQENPVKRKMVKKQNCSLEQPKSTTGTESSRDSRRMAQVARQLISLSEKKWWK